MSPANSSTTVDVPVIESLIVDVNAFIIRVRSENSIAIHQKIDQFYYMEKREELLVLNERIYELQSRITLMEAQRSACFAEVRQRLSIDQEWLTGLVNPTTDII